MKKVNVTLEFVNLREGTMHTEEVAGYQFDAVTKDGAIVKAAVYKHHGGWLVNDMEGANAKVINIHRRTRKEAVDGAMNMISRVSNEQIQAKLASMKQLKHGLKTTEVSA